MVERIVVDGSISTIGGVDEIEEEEDVGLTVEESGGG